MHADSYSTDSGKCLARYAAPPRASAAFRDNGTENSTDWTCSAKHAARSLAALLERVVTMAKALTLGHGLRNREVGAINSALQFDRIGRFAADARARGLAIVAGGSATMDPDSGKGWFFEPTVVDRLAPDDRLVQDEIFGPVLAVQVADSPEEALSLANGTAFGLAAGIYTRDLNRALTLARDLDAGQVYVNEYYAGGVEVPFGGNKRSGFGREKGIEGVRAYTRVKSVAARL